MNPFQMIGSPQKFLGQQLQSRLNDMMRRNPQAYQRAIEMTQGKSEAEMKQTALNLAKERGVDLGGFASQFGIKL